MGRKPKAKNADTAQLALLPDNGPATIAKVARQRRARSTEVDAYVFIKENLRLRGWDIHQRRWLGFHWRPCPERIVGYWWHILAPPRPITSADWLQILESE